jgi:PTS system nitrogen regulatory IIA component
MNLSVTDAARLLDTTPERIYECIDDGEIPFHRVSDQFRFHRAELLEWATARGMRVSVDLFHLGDGAADKPLVDALEHGGIHRDISAEDRSSAIRAIVDRLPITDPDQRSMVCDVLVARDALRSTVGDGIAIPHVRSPIVLHGCTSAISVCFLSRPVDCGAPDGKPVTTAFMVVTPTPKAHLFLLSRLSSALLDPDFKAAIMRRASDGEILEQASRVEDSFIKEP